MQIDFVIPWLDRNDPEWQSARKQYSHSVLDKANAFGATDANFYDWGDLQYWFRGVEKFAPWVNRIHLIANGPLPKWLDAKNPKLHIVRHADYIPHEYLPTFSPNPIALNVHRIEGLSEHFVYFSEGMYLINSVRPEDFFRKSLPTDHCGLTIALIDKFCNFDIAEQINNLVILSRHFSLQSIRKHIGKWIHPKNGMSNVFRTLFLELCPRLPGFCDLPLPISYEKRTFEEVWSQEAGTLDTICKNRFRTFQDANQRLMQNWRNLKGEFTPAAALGKTAVIQNDPKCNLKTATAIRSQACKVLGLHSSDTLQDFDGEQRRLNQALEAVFLEKCSYEI